MGRLRRAGYTSTSNSKHKLSATQNTLPDWEVGASGKRLKKAGVTLTIALYDGPEPGPADVVAGLGALGLTISAIWATDNLKEQVSLVMGEGAYEGYKESDASKNEKHGDGGRAKTKAEKQIEQLQEQLKDATGNLKKQLKKKIENIRKTAEQKAKGEEHSRVGKR